jgi:DnaB-like helicase N terminal domain
MTEPPRNIEAEQAVLGGILLDNSALEDSGYKGRKLLSRGSRTPALPLYRSTPPLYG